MFSVKCVLNRMSSLQKCVLYRMCFSIEWLGMHTHAYGPMAACVSTHLRHTVTRAHEAMPFKHAPKHAPTPYTHCTAVHTLYRSTHTVPQYTHCNIIIYYIYIILYVYIYIYVYNIYIYIYIYDAFSFVSKKAIHGASYPASKAEIQAVC